MRLYEVLTQQQTNYLYEGLTPSAKKSMQLWESAGHKLVEAELTVDQINQIFTQVEKDTTGAGGNRTLIGKGKDAASAVNRAWEDLKTKIQNSEPVKNVDAMYDQAADKLKQATGGDQGVMQYVQKYRNFAKKHPVAQSFIYAALIAAAGISGAGVGGAAALGLFKMVDKLLQGEKFSSAAYSGAKTGAAAYAAGQIGKAMQGGMEKFSGTDRWRTLDGMSQSTIKDGKIVGDIMINNQVYSPGSAGYEQALKIATKHAADGNMLGTAKDFTAASSKAVKDLGKDSFGGFKESQVRALCVAVSSAEMLNESPLDAIKGLAQKGIAKAKTVGHNLTTKITADKLMQAWKKAGSPTDSETVADVLIRAGANKDIVNNAMSAIVGKSANSTASSTGDTSDVQEPETAQEPTQAASGNKFRDLITKLTDYVDNGGSVSPKLRGAVKNIWMQMGGVRIESRD